MLALKSSVVIIASAFSLMMEPGWQEVNQMTVKVKITLPQNGLQQVADSGFFLYSSKTTDDLVSAQAFVYGDYSLADNPELSAYMVQTGETDTLSVIAKYMVANSNGGQLVYLQKQLNTPTKKIMDVGIKHIVQLENGNTPFISYTRYYVDGRRMVIMSLSAQESYLNPLIDARNRTWNSLVLY